MNGRLETQLKTEKRIQKILDESPEYLVEYYYNLSSKREAKSCLEYLYKIMAFLKFINLDVSQINIKEITEIDVARYMKSIETTDRYGVRKETSFSYRKQNHTILNSFFTYLLKRGYIDKDPMVLIERETSRDNVKRKFLTEEELKIVIDNLKEKASAKIRCRDDKWNARDLAVMMVFIQTGIRESALCDINISDIDFENQRLLVIDKGHKENDIILSPEVIVAIEKWIKRRKELINESKRNGKKIEDTDALFISNRLTRISTIACSDIVKKYVKESLGFEISPHKLRAAYANILLRKTGNLHLVSKLMGHARPDTTEIYLDDNNDEDKMLAATLISQSIFI